VASADPNQDLVSGTGHFELVGVFDTQIHVNAQSGPSGEDPRGHFFATQETNGGFADADFSGRVTCVSVKDNLAGVGGVVTKSKNPSVAVGSGILVSIEDRGPGAEDAGGALVTSEPPQEPPTECPFSFIAETQKGNYVVHDATP
jgi:hypothetical protein